MGTGVGGHWLDWALIPTKQFVFNRLLRGDYARYLQLRARAAIVASRWGLYERSTIAAAAHLVRPGDVVLDVGANFGAYTAAFLRMVGPAGRVHAFEPQPDVFAHLQAEFGDCPTVVLEQVALASRAGVGHLRVPTVAAGVPEPALATLAEEGIAVTVTTLDDHCADFDRLRYVKVDAEGHDLDVLRGGVRTFRRLRPLIQFECNDPQTLVEFTDFGAGVGYRLGPVVHEHNYWLVPD